MTIPETWTDVTDDVCPRPRMGVRYADPEEMQEPENIHPRHEHDYTVKCGAKRLDLSKHWTGRYKDEREWLLVMVGSLGTFKAIAKQIKVATSTVTTRAAEYGIHCKRGRHGGLAE